MLKLKIYLALTLLLFCGSLSAQKLHWGVANNDEGKIYDVIGVDNKFMYALQYTKVRGKGHLLLNKYGLKDMGLESSNEVVLNGEKRKGEYNVMGLYMIKGRFFLFTTEHHRKEDRYVAYVQELSGNADPIGALTELGEISDEGRRDNGFFSLTVSPDSSRFLLMRKPNTKLKDTEKYKFAIYDLSFKKLFQLEAQMPYTEEEFDMRSVYLANNNDILMLGAIKRKRRDRDKDDADLYYNVVAISPSNKNDVKEYNLDIDNRKIIDLGARLSRDGSKLLLAGFYQNLDTRKSGINGIFYMNLDVATKAISAKNLKEFEKEFVAREESMKDAKKGRGISSNFDLSRFYLRPDGGVYIVAEEKYVIEHTYTNSKGQTYTSYHYHRNQILVWNINPQGKIEWYSSIPKQQHTVNDGGAMSSFVSTYADGKLYFFYNDSKKNYSGNTHSTFEEMRSPKNAVLTAATVDESGHVSYQMVMDADKKKQCRLNPALSSRLSNGELLMFGTAPRQGFWSGKTTRYRIGRFTPKPRIEAL